MNRKLVAVAGGGLVAALGLGTLLGVVVADRGDGPGVAVGGQPTPTPSASASASPSPSPVATPTKPTVQPTVKPTVKPTPPPPVPGVVMTTKAAYLAVSEDPNLTTPDPENGCEAHDPDLTVTRCGVEKMPGGTATWVVGREKGNLPGAFEPRVVIRIYRRISADTDEMTHVAFGDPGVWADAEVVVASLTGQHRDTLVVQVVFSGSGTMRGYDLVTWRAGNPGPRLQAHHEAGSKGAIRLANGGVELYSADYSDGSPNCCPKIWDRDRAKWDPAIKKFRLQKLPDVSKVPA